MELGSDGNAGFGSGKAVDGPVGAEAAGIQGPARTEPGAVHVLVGARGSTGSSEAEAGVAQSLKAAGVAEMQGPAAVSMAQH